MPKVGGTALSGKVTNPRRPTLLAYLQKLEIRKNGPLSCTNHGGPVGRLESARLLGMGVERIGCESVCVGPDPAWRQSSPKKRGQALRRLGPNDLVR